MEFSGDEAGDQAGEAIGEKRVSFFVSLRGGERVCGGGLGLTGRARRAKRAKSRGFEVWGSGADVSISVSYDNRRVVLTVTPQNRAKTMMSGGFSSIAIKVLGVRAETIWARVTAKISVTKTMKKL